MHYVLVTATFTSRNGAAGTYTVICDSAGDVASVLSKKDQITGGGQKVIAARETEVNSTPQTSYPYSDWIVLWN